MSNFLGIGFVYNYEKKYSVKYILKDMIKLLVKYDGYVKNIKYSNDKKGSKWVEVSDNILIDSKNYDKYIEGLVKGYFGEILVYCKFLSRKDVPVYIRLHKENDFFEILLDIEEKNVVDADKNVIHKTDEIIMFINEVYKQTLFEYSFCDNNCSVEYSLNELNELNKLNELRGSVYSLVCVPQNDNKLKIIKSNWEIDGITERI